MFRLGKNRIYQILESHEDRRYILACMAFKELAKLIGLKKNTNIQYVMVYLTSIMLLKILIQYWIKWDDETVLQRIGPDYLFMLLSATYIHDIAMQSHYTGFFKEYSNDFDSLNDEDRSKLRKHHAETIQKVLDNLKDIKSVQLFFGEKIMRFIDNVSVCDGNLFDNTLKLIRDKSKQIGIIARWHNYDFKRLKSFIEASKVEATSKLVLNEGEEEKLLICASLLQYADGLDMGINRVDQKLMAHLVQDISSLKVEDLLLVKKIFRSYIIDKVDCKYSSTSKTFNINFILSLSQQDIESNSEFLNEMKNDYNKRVTRNENDCLKQLEKFFDFNTKISLLEVTPIVSTSKVKFPESFFEAISIKSTGLKSYLQDTLTEITEDSVFSYFKFCSPLGNSFYGGEYYYPTLNKEKYNISPVESKLCERMNQYIFIEYDWPLDAEEDYKYSTTNDEIRSTELKIKYAIGYKHYFSL